MRYFLNPDKPGPSGLNVQGSSSKKLSGTLTFDEFYAEREEARRGDFNPKPKKIIRSLMNCTSFASNSFRRLRP